MPQKEKNPQGSWVSQFVTNHVMFEKLSKNGASVINVFFKEKRRALLKRVLRVSGAGATSAHLSSACCVPTQSGALSPEPLSPELSWLWKMLEVWGGGRWRAHLARGGLGVSGRVRE